MSGSSRERDAGPGGQAGGRWEGESRAGSWQPVLGHLCFPEMGTLSRNLK